jgi:hypothetical protein
MQRPKRLTKKERKALSPGPATGTNNESHIHCIACGRHLDPEEFDSTPPTATALRCDHGTQFPSCVACTVQSKLLIEAHDRSGQPVKTAGAWH